MGALTFLCFCFINFSKLIVNCCLWVIYVREDNDSSIQVMITWLIWITPWTSMSMSTALERPLNLITHSLFWIHPLLISKHLELITQDFFFFFFAMVRIQCLELVIISCDHFCTMMIVCAVFTKLIGYVGHFRWLGPKVCREISQIWIK